MAKLGNNDEAVDAFGAAVAVASKSRGHKLFEALALRDWARALPHEYAGTRGGTEKDAHPKYVRALQVLEGMPLSVEQFDALRI